MISDLETRRLFWLLEAHALEVLELSRRGEKETARAIEDRTIGSGLAPFNLDRDEHKGAVEHYFDARTRHSRDLVEKLRADPNTELCAEGAHDGNPCCRCGYKGSSECSR